MSRLFEQYNSEIKKSLQEKFQYGNVMEILNWKKSLSTSALVMQ